MLSASLLENQSQSVPDQSSLRDDITRRSLVLRRDLWNRCRNEHGEQIIPRQVSDANTAIIAISMRAESRLDVSRGVRVSLYSKYFSLNQRFADKLAALSQSGVFSIDCC